MPVRIAMLGDSIAAGLGARGRQFPVLVAEDLGAELMDLSTSARQIRADDADAVRDATVVVIAHGVTEGILRPSTRALRCVPPRWRRDGWLDPRPFFSEQRCRGLSQRLESGIRWRVKSALLRVFGPEQWTRPEHFSAVLQAVVEGCGAERVVLVGGFTLDDRFFPNSASELELYAAISRDVAATTGARYVDVAAACDRWEDYLADHFHPSQTGHRKIADAVTPAVHAATSMFDPNAGSVREGGCVPALSPPIAPETATSSAVRNGVS